MNESCALPFLSSYNDMANRQFEFGIGFENRLRQPVQLHLQTDLRALRSTFSEYVDGILRAQLRRSEEHTSELQSLMRISYAVFCLKKKIHNTMIQDE